MDVHWMQNFLGLLQCDATPSASSMPLKTNRPLSLDDLELEDDMRYEFSCPVCYEDLDIGSLCSHLEEEHCLESKSAICPVCAAKVGNDVVGHITLQHGHVLKMQRRRRTRQAGTSYSSTLSLIGKELREAYLQAHLGGNTYRYAANTSTPAGTDPLLCSLVSSLPIPEIQDVSKPTAASGEDCQTRPISTDQNKTSLESPLTTEECEEKLQEAALRAKFVQQLVLSTIFCDD